MVRAARPDLIYKAICSGNIQWNISAAENMLRDERTKNFAPTVVKGWLCNFVLSKGSDCVKVRPETDDYWLEVNPDDPWWYKVNIEFSDRPTRLFVKMKLVDPDEEANPGAEIVSVHF